MVQTNSIYLEKQKPGKKQMNPREQTVIPLLLKA